MKLYKVLCVILNTYTNTTETKYLIIYANNEYEVKDNIELYTNEEMLEYQIVSINNEDINKNKYTNRCLIF